jgi:hypothetical protein
MMLGYTKTIKYDTIEKIIERDAIDSGDSSKRYLNKITISLSRWTMQVFLRIDLNLFMAAVCIIMFFANRAISEKRLIHNRIFRWLIISVFLLLILESLTWILDGASTEPLMVCNYIVTISLFLLTPMPAFIWSLYVDSQIFHDTKTLKK